MNKTYYQIGSGGKQPFWTRRKVITTGIVFAVAAAVVVLVVVIVLEVKKEPDSPRTSLDAAMNINDIMTHLRALNAIADANNGTRALNSSGYAGSVNYVYNQLKNNPDFEVYLQDFYVPGSVQQEIPKLKQTYPLTKEYQFGVQFGVINFFACDVDFEANLTVAANFGCNTETDYTSFEPGNIALVRRGNCTNGEKLAAAKQHNISALIIFNEGNVPERTAVFIGSVGNVTDIPVFSLMNNIGEVLSVLEGVTLHIKAKFSPINFFTQNVIADTLKGSAESVIVVGAHLDSVAAGPGINDDGSGTATNLELALQVHKTKLTDVIVSKIRFAWWAAEELGLLGSSFYVKDMVSRNDPELQRIKANLNFDMLGSPNFMRGIYDGASGNVLVRNGSAAIQGIFEGYFTIHSLDFQLTPFNGRSDYGPFIAEGIPAGGLFTGAEVLKTNNERTMYGGLSNSPYDPCYHLACDTVENINTQVLQEMAQGAAFVLEKLATQENLAQYLNPGHQEA